MINNILKISTFLHHLIQFPNTITLFNLTTFYCIRHGKGLAELWINPSTATVTWHSNMKTWQEASWSPRLSHFISCKSIPNNISPAMWDVTVFVHKKLVF
jgi:hypothetical protein